MHPSHNVYIALGSNKGDRFKNLQDAVDLIFARLGTIHAIAKVYSSKAFGFEADDFLNTCV
ncbi:MAG TPA: 2-amino-4-hydroxy-6-hydroxymethyldihydropteridine diphosphokinase, partial [Aquaticitalea sp.]|nr:2-amino-4-hydroxy-6-hydroxymethyldihydropteridine diphosphokinase [Aquaticitalea sp.]